jgi:hypothetical protein
MDAESKIPQFSRISLTPCFSWVCTEISPVKTVLIVFNAESHRRDARATTTHGKNLDIPRKFVFLSVCKWNSNSIRWIP